MTRLLPVIAVACLSFYTSCASEKDAALQASEQMVVLPDGRVRVNLFGLEEWKRDCGFVESLADDPVVAADMAGEGFITEGYLTKLLLACAR